MGWYKTRFLQHYLGQRLTILPFLLIRSYISPFIFLHRKYANPFSMQNFHWITYTIWIAVWWWFNLSRNNPTIICLRYNNISYITVTTCYRPVHMYPTFHPKFSSRVGWNVGWKSECWMNCIIYICTLSSNIIIQHFKDHWFFKNSKWWTHVHLHK